MRASGFFHPFLPTVGVYVIYLLDGGVLVMNYTQSSRVV